MPFQNPEAYYSQAGQVPLDMSGEFQSEGVPDPRSFGVVANTPNPLQYISDLMGRGLTGGDQQRIGSSQGVDASALADLVIPGVDAAPAPAAPAAPTAQRAGTTRVEQLPPLPSSAGAMPSGIPSDFEVQAAPPTAPFPISQGGAIRNVLFGEGNPFLSASDIAHYQKNAIGLDPFDPDSNANLASRTGVNLPTNSAWRVNQGQYIPEPSDGAQNPIRALIMELFSGLGGGESAAGSDDSAHAGDLGRQKALSEAERRQKNQGK